MKKLNLLNKALLFKWCWRFAILKGAFWNKVIKGKYEEQEGGWCTLDRRREGGFGLGFWKAILSCWSCVSVTPQNRGSVDNPSTRGILMDVG